MDFETVVGLEIHLQLNTTTKAFCGDTHIFGKPANTQTSVISLAHPGTLPVLNEKQLEKAVMLGMILEGEIQTISRFDRKHYFYPDLSKAYQITQEQHPISIGGYLNIPIGEEEKKIRIHHIHMEEDAGKSIHDQDPSYSHIDYNRAGVPLIEIVTEPDLRSGQEVYNFLTRFQKIIRYLGISDANMEEGSLRCDCNVSIRPMGDSTYGQRCEIKNLNSRRFAKQAVEYEAKRQIELFKLGNRIPRDTRQFDTATGITKAIRSKEEVQDYRYFHDPDLPAIQLTTAYLDKIRTNLPKLPSYYQDIFLNKYDLEKKDIEVLTENSSIAEYFLSLVSSYPHAKSVAKLLINKVIPWLNQNRKEIHQFPLKKVQLIELLELVRSKKISHTAGFQQVFPALVLQSELSPDQIMRSLGLVQQSNKDQLLEIAQLVLNKHPEEFNRYKAGKKGLIGFFIGAGMKDSKGAANPKLMKEIFLELLGD